VAEVSALTEGVAPLAGVEAPPVIVLPVIGGELSSEFGVDEDEPLEVDVPEAELEVPP
jgi:hypothetical protein